MFGVWKNFSAAIDCINRKASQLPCTIFAKCISITRYTKSKYKFTKIIFAAAAICQCLALGQIKRGSIVVISFSPHRVVFAGDSRTVFLGANGKKFFGNCECKLLALKSNLIGGFTGTLGRDLKPGQKGHPWSIQDVSKSAVARAGNNATIEAIARQWANDMKAILETELRDSTSSIQRDKKILASGTFAGIVKPDQLVVYSVRILKLNPLADDVTFSINKEPRYRWSSCRHRWYGCGVQNYARIEQKRY